MERILLPKTFEIDINSVKLPVDFLYIIIQIKMLRILFIEISFVLLACNINQVITINKFESGDSNGNCNFYPKFPSLRDRWRTG
jgi:hypothetical protein